MTPEEYNRIKEAEKEHLRALKKLKQTARLFERRKSVNQALGNMVSGSKDALDTHEEMLDKLTLETAQQEARLEIALENAALEDAAGTPVRSLEQLEEELTKERAKSLIRQMKIQMGVLETSIDATPAEPTPPASAKDAEAPASLEEAAPPPVERPDKTIGRMK